MNNCIDYEVLNMLLSVCVALGILFIVFTILIGLLVAVFFGQCIVDKDNKNFEKRILDIVHKNRFKK